MIAATITSKGQITIPQRVRKYLHLHTGDKVSFELHDGKEAVLKPITKSIDEVFGMLHKAENPVVSVDAMNAAIRKRMQEKSG